MTLDLNKPIPAALFDLRRLINPTAWSLLTALIENEYSLSDCPFAYPGPLSVDTLSEMTGLDQDTAREALWWMQGNSFIPVEIYFEENAGGMFRLDLNKTSRHLTTKEVN